MINILNNLDFYKIIGGMELVLAFFGIVTTILSERSKCYKLKLILVYSLLLTYGTLGLFTNIDLGTLEVMYIMFLYCLVILHYRESKVDHDKIQKLYLWLNSVLKNSPDLFWIKDKDNKILYTNRATRDILFAQENPDDWRYPIGKTGITIAEETKARGVKYTAGYVCTLSDDIAKESKETCTFLEDFKIKGRPVFLLVNKTPYYDKDNKIQGTVGTGRDVTIDIGEHKQLVKLYKQKKYKEFEKLWEIHLNKNFIADVREKQDSKLIRIN